jgi:hypothetical protein
MTVKQNSNIKKVAERDGLISKKHQNFLVILRKDSIFAHKY